MHIGHLLLLITALILGIRHGIDWDHIAAITDISGSQSGTKKSIIQGMTYALGHGAVIITLGLLAVLLGIRIPGWVDHVMEPVVGLTLILLGVWLLGSIIINRKNFKLMSKWMLVFYIHRKFRGHNDSKNPHYDAISKRGAWIVGMLHGIGAETPTQLLLFTTAAGVGGAVMGTLLVFSFVIGLLISNFFITLMVVFGFSKLQNSSPIYLGLGSLSGIFSLIVGFIFLTGNSFLLPTIIGG